MIESPVALIIFNRPECTAEVFARIAAARPRRLFVIADGPRPGRPEDVARCEAARAVTERVDWDCEVWRNYSAENLGCGRRPATGIDWVFEHVDRAIILEDDCVADPSFFPYCDELLDRFADDERVMQIAGSNFLGRPARGGYSYGFSIHNTCYGWATWRRAWRHFDIAVTDWPVMRDTSWLRDLVEDERAAAYWARQFERAYQAAGDVDFWDYQWTFACWRQGGLTVVPTRNLISNIGFGPEATHTRSPGDPRSRLPTSPLWFPLAHPPFVTADRAADRDFVAHVIGPYLPPPATTYWKVRRAVTGLLPAALRRELRAALRRRNGIPRATAG